MQSSLLLGKQEGCVRLSYPERLAQFLYHGKHSAITAYSQHGLGILASKREPSEVQMEGWK